MRWERVQRVWKVLGALGGGLVFYGGLIGGAIAVWWYCGHGRSSSCGSLTSAIPIVALGQAFGRLGCFSAGCCWGKRPRCTLPLAVHFPGPARAKNLFGRHTAGRHRLDSQAQELKRWVVESTGQIFDHPVPGAVRISEWVAQHGTTLPIHPTQLYESLAQLCSSCCC